MDRALESIEGGLRSLLYPPSAGYMRDVDKRAQDVYRRLVRGNIYKVVRMAVPILRDIIGDAAVDAEIEKWIASVPPQSKLLRMLPEEFSAWAVAQEDLAHPAMAELIHWETLEIGILHAPNDDENHPHAPHNDGYIAASNSARLCTFAYPVHRMKKGDGWPSALPAPVIVLGFRRGERLDWVELPPSVGQTIVLVAQGQTLGAAFGVLEDAGHAIDPAFVRSWLVDLRARGALVGFPDYIDDETQPSEGT